MATHLLFVCYELFIQNGALREPLGLAQAYGGFLERSGTRGEASVFHEMRLASDRRDARVMCAHGGVDRSVDVGQLRPTSDDGRADLASRIGPPRFTSHHTAHTQETGVRTHKPSRLTRRDGDDTQNTRGSRITVSGHPSTESPTETHYHACYHATYHTTR